MCLKAYLWNIGFIHRGTNLLGNLMITLRNNIVDIVLKNNWFEIPISKATSKQNNKHMFCKYIGSLYF